MRDAGTIKIKKEVRDALKKLRVYPRETYDETLERMINNEIKKNIKRKLMFR